MIIINVYIASHCPACKRVVSILKTFSEFNSQTKVNIINIANSTSPISIVPAIFLNDEFYCYGEINKDKLKLKVNEMLK